MKLRTVSLLLCAIMTAGCIAPASHAERKELVFSIQMTKSEKPTGCFFYYFPEYKVIFPERLEQGTLITPRAIGIDPAKLSKQLAQIGFVPFDLEKEIARVDAIPLEEERRDPKKLLPMRAFDGAEYEIRFVFGGIDYTARMWNPMSDLDSYAPYSPKIAKLKALIDLFALNYGRSEFE